MSAFTTVARQLLGMAAYDGSLALAILAIVWHGGFVRFLGRCRSADLQFSSKESCAQAGKPHRHDKPREDSMGSHAKATLLATFTLVASAVGGQAQQTLATVKARGVLHCGVSTGIPGFSNPDDKGNWSGLDVDFCKAIAAAVLGDRNKVKYVPTTASDRFTALQSGQVDLLARNTTWTMSRDTAFTFGPVNYYDGQGFMVKKTSAVKSVKELNGAVICVQAGTTTELNLADYFQINKIEYKVLTFQTLQDTLHTYLNGRCDAFTTDASGLLAQRAKFTDPQDHIVLPEIISKEPLSPVVRQDFPWFTIVKWTHYAMVNAEEYGVTSRNIEEMMSSNNPEIRRLLGTEGEFGKGIGLDNDWVVKIIKAVGNYGESFERNVGSGSPLSIARGYNALWSKGGLQYAPPMH
jgi:general L-amino acid transport system substrate-binding protein